MNLDNQYHWKRSVIDATTLGVEHGILKRKALSEKELIKTLTDKYNMIIHLRNGHSRELRRAYGAGYGGIAVSRRAYERTFYKVNP